MRVYEDSDGNLQVDNEPMKVGGADAERILEEMERPATPEQERFAAECVAIYKQTIGAIKEP